MSYLSIRFATFVILTLCVYYAVPIKKRWTVLLAGSILFYLSYPNGSIFFFLYTAGITYLAGRWMEKYPDWKKDILLLGILVNAVVWFVIKDYNWAAGLLNYFVDAVRMPTIQNMIVPVGISYYMLQAIGYLADVYHGKPAEHNFFRYALFLGWFPAIVQGPISRYDQLAPQLMQEHRFDFDVFRSELLLILYGIIKKMVIADNIAMIANFCFRNADTLEGFSLYIGAVAYSIQLYMDFSGCVDICRGVSGLFGIHLQQNFDAPYFAQSIKEFWAKWHISLSSWLKDYIYIPLGGNKKGKVRKYWNIVIVFLVSAVWHGAGLSFLVWGILHAVYQIVGEVTLPLRKKVKQLIGVQEGSLSEKIYKTVITFHLVTFAWIFFRASSLMGAFAYIQNMFSRFNLWVLFDGSLYTYGVSRNLLNLVMLNLIIVLMVDFAHRKKKCGLRQSILSLHIVQRWIVYFVLIYDVLICGAYGVGVDPSAFLYGGF